MSFRVVFLACLFFLAVSGEIQLKNGWKVVEEKIPDPNKLVLSLLLPVKQRTDGLSDLVLKVSDPFSPQYGQYLSFEEIGEITRPSAETIQAVQNWLENIEASQIDWNPHREFVRFSVLARKISASARWRYVQHPFRSEKPPLVRSLDLIPTPQELQGHIDFFHGVNVHDLMAVSPPRNRQDRREHRASAMVGVPNNTALSGLFVSAFDSLVTGQVEIYGDRLPQVSSVVVVLSQPWGNQTTQLKQVLSPDSVVEFSFENIGNVVGSSVSAQIVYRNGTVEPPVYYQSTIYPGPLITPNVAKRLYSIPDHEYGVLGSMSVAEFDGQYYSPQDLKQFLDLVNYSPSAGVHPNVTVHGANIPSLPGGESTLDVDWILAIAPNVPLTYWSVGLGGWLLEWVQGLSAMQNPPLVHSISYGSPESDETLDYMNRVNDEFKKLAARGVTVFTTSGDIGVEDGLDCFPDVADYPSSSPWTTSLGATSLVRNTDQPICSLYRCDQMEEVPCAADLGSDFTTGGGFSSYFPTPPYQTSAVQNYLKVAPNLPPPSFFNASGRGYNDIAALGFRMLVVLRGRITTEGGTSASGPLAAGLFALLNSARLAAGMPPMGFLNPWLYAVAQQNPDAFHPVASATNACEETGNFGETDCCQYGFSSTPSWNPLGGLGTPNYAILKELALQTQTPSLLKQQ